MSHVVKIQIKVFDLDALAVAAAALGCELVTGQKHYKWYGKSVGDTALPDGFTVADLGKCDHVIRVKDAHSGTYEVGVVRNRNGEPGYTLLWDSWHGGYGLEEKVGKDATRLRQEYAAQVAEKQARRMGKRVRRSAREDGLIVLTVY